jgi:hypothetical protein
MKGERGKRKEERGKRKEELFYFPWLLNTKIFSKYSKNNTKPSDCCELTFLFPLSSFLLPPTTFLLPLLFFTC